MIIGLDNGYMYTKSSEGVMFMSTLKKGKDIDINKDTLQVNIDGEDYIVGSVDGSLVADNNKIDSLVTEVCTFTAIAKSLPDSTFIEAEIVVGLPVSYYSKQKDAFKEKLLNYGMKRVKIGNHHSQDIRIVKVDVFPQAAGVVFLNAKDLKNDDTFVIDVGGGTVDCSYFKGLKLIDKATYPKGMITLYSQLAQKINNDYYTNFDKLDLDEKFQKGYINTSKGKIDIVKMYEEDFINHIEKLSTDIKYDFKTIGNMDHVLVIGGGGIRLFDKINRLFPNAKLIDNAQFSNAIAFKYMGEMKNR
jgi:plasmid segregation protein ParM